jgi:hypothetical protein
LGKNIGELEKGRSFVAIKAKNMAKTLIIEVEEQDENVLLEFLKTLKVKFRPLSMEEEIIRENLHNQYVVTGEWDNMNLEAREDAVLYERILLTDRSKTVNTNDFLRKLRQQ